MSEQARKKLPLKNGGEIEADVGLAIAGALDSLLTQQPDHLQALWAIVQGDSEGVDEKSVAYLKRQYLLQRDGTVHPAVSDVLLSSLQEAPDGPVIVNPFRFATGEEARAVERIEEEGIRRLIQELGLDGGRGRPR